ncbi:MAG: CYTH domain-containing protein [Solirubrobacteraceae bacterium]
MEIERKFLVDQRSAGRREMAPQRIEQGYLALDGDVEVRLRRREQRGCTLTIKAGSGRSRLEQELELAESAFVQLWPLTDGRRLVKRRSLLDEIELDVYEGELAGLAVAEVEFASEPEADGWQPPEWLGRELTGDPRYSNRALACGGVPA